MIPSVGKFIEFEYQLCGPIKEAPLRFNGMVVSAGKFSAKVWSSGKMMGLVLGMF